MADPKRKVVQHFMITELRSEVKRLQDEGWEPEGRMEVTDGLYSMYMVKNEIMGVVDWPSFKFGSIDTHLSGYGGDIVTSYKIPGADFHMIKSIMRKLHRVGCILGSKDLGLTDEQMLFVAEFANQQFHEK